MTGLNNWKVTKQLIDLTKNEQFRLDISEKDTLLPALFTNEKGESFIIYMGDMFNQDKNQIINFYVIKEHIEKTFSFTKGDELAKQFFQNKKFSLINKDLKNYSYLGYSSLHDFFYILLYEKIIKKSTE